MLNTSGEFTSAPFSISWDRRDRFDVDELLEGFSDIAVAESGGVSVAIRKRGAVPDSPFVDTRARERELLQAVMNPLHRLSWGAGS